MNTNAIKPVLKVVLPYLLFGGIYIAFSDKFVHAISQNQNMITELQTYKGWGFIILTSLLLVILLFRFFNKLERERNGLALLKETLSRSENLYHSLFMNSGEAIILTNRDGSFKAANPEACRIFGRTEEEICRLGREAITDITDPRLQAALQERKSNGIFKGELNFLRKDGSKFPAEVVTTTFKDMNGVERASTIIRDISEKKLAEEALHLAHTRLRRFVDANIIGVVVATADGRILEANDYYLNMIGYTRAELEEGKVDWRKLTPQEWLFTDEKALIELKENGICRPYEKEYQKRDGTRVAVYLADAILPGTEETIAAFALDITDKKRAELELKENEERYRSLFINMIEGFAYCKMLYDNGVAYDFEFLKSNEKLTTLTGLRDVDGKKVSEIIPSFYKDNPEVFEICGRVALIGNPEHFETFVPALNEWYSVSIYSTKKYHFVAMFELITKRKLVELELIESEERYRSLFENMSEGFAYCKMIYENEIPIDFIYLKTNPIFSTLTGLKDVEGKRVSEVIPGFCDSNPEIIDLYGRVALNGRPEHVESYLPLLDDWYSVSVYCPKREYFIAVFDVITERKKIELDLIKNRRFLADLIENSGTLIFVKDFDGRYELINKKWEAITGLKRSKVIGKTDDELFPGSDGESFRKNDLIVMQTCTMIETEEILSTEDKKRFFISIKFPTFDEDGKVNGICGVSTEITERKLAEEALRRSEERFRSIVEGAPDAIFIQAEGKFIFLNPAAYELFGYDSEDGIIDTNVIDHIHPDYRLIAAERMKILNTERKSVVDLKEQIFLKKDGSELWVETKGEPITYKEKNGALVFVRDISQRKKVEEDLRASEEKYRTITENINDVVWILDIAEERFTYVSPSVFNLRGYTPEEIIAQPVYEALTHKSIDSLNEITAQRIEEFISDKNSKKTYTDQLEQPCKDGSTVWTEVVTSLYLNEKTGNINVRGVTRNISDRKKIQDALIASEERFRSTLDNMLEGCQIIDTDWRYVYINDAADNHNRRPKSELLGRKYMDAWPGIEESNVFKLIYDCMDNKVTHQFENKFTYPDGSVGWFDLSIQPVAEGVFILSIDITERKKAEQEILNSRENLRALTARLEKVREEERIHLSRELHDHLGQNLTGLKMDVAYVEKHIRNDSKIDEESILLKTKGMVDLIDDLIKNVRKISSELRPNVLDYLGLIPAIEWQIEEFTKRTEIECDYDSNSSKIDFGMEINSSVFRIIQEAFTNIIRHSKATKVYLRIKDKTDFILVEIKDNGIGIRKEEIYNVKSLGILGMQERTLHFNGKLQIENAPEGGTLLSLTIPKEIQL